MGNGVDGQPFAGPLRVASPSETPHRERPGKRIGWRRRGGQAGGTALVLFDVGKSVDQEKISTCDGQWVQGQHSGRLSERMLRPGELVSLQVEDIPLTERILTIREVGATV
jgi:hypothetical protein